MHTVSQYFSERRQQFNDIGKEKINQEYNKKCIYGMSKGSYKYSKKWKAQYLFDTCVAAD